MTEPAYDPVPQIALDLELPRAGVAAVVALLADGNTVPFIARYRKEATGNLDEVQIRAIQERSTYLRELHDRRQTILASIAEQGKLTDELRQRIEACATKAELEDLYLPYKPRRRTRATIARERGLGPLGERILAQPRDGDPEREAAAFVDPAKEVPDIDAALKGARDIAAEAIAETAEIRALIRDAFRDRGELVAEATTEAQAQRTRFEQYYDYREPVARVPSHRYLAVRRGERENMLRVKIDLDLDPILPRVEEIAHLDPASPFAAQLREAITDACKRIVLPGVETDVRVEMKLDADRDAVEIFARNLRELLLASPLGGKPVIGVDPGIRTGCKTVVLDATGRLLDNTVIYPGQGARRDEEARDTLARLVRTHTPAAIAIGNGTGGRETERFVRQAMKDAGLDPLVVQVNESGASVYSASDIAREEFPDHDLTVRGAVSIGRRLQDPLAELVKIDPKSIGVGQYQHDVHQPLLQRKLDEVVESCVNHVGVSLNTASAPLLAQVAGIGPSLAKKIVTHRDQNGRFDRRADLLRVSGLGPRTFEQCAGFLRIPDSQHPLDASAVHPERYPLVERMAQDLGVDVRRLVGDATLVERIELSRYVQGDVGLPTLEDIITELKKPGRDPRTEFSPPQFRDDVEKLEDLQDGMTLEGVVTNVTAFGAFVDVGVHQDGLVHISQLSDRFVRDPSEVVSPGDRITVRVLSVDLERRRIALTAKKGRDPEAEREAQAQVARPTERRAPDPARRSGGRDSRGRSDNRGSGGRDDNRGGARSDQRSGGRDDNRGGGGQTDQRSGGGRNDNRGGGGGRNDNRGGGGRNDNRGGGRQDGFKHNPFADLLRRR
ncbi:MAG: Tex-like N-terminal domain-containing protein [bacterium]